MASKKTGNSTEPKKIHNTAPPQQTTFQATVSSFLLPIHQPMVQGLLLVLISILLYANTFTHQYAVDDYVVIVENEFTKKGFAGIKDHFTNDSFTGFFGKRADELLEGGRYRPLSLVTFAMEWQIFGRSPGLSHVVNVLFYGLLIFLLWDFLKKHIFRYQPEFAFWTTLLFAIHPIHTEVVANVKGRDELLSMILLVISTQWCMDYYRHQSKNILLLIGALVTYFLALLAKENGFTWVVILPLTLFVFTRLKSTKMATATVLYTAVLGLYFLVRIKLTGPIFSNALSTEILNSPYMNASFVEKYATIIWVLGKYFVMLVFPHPLAWDYSFNQIPYKNLSDPTVWLSLTALVGILGYGFYRLPKRDPIAYGILFYYFSLFVSSNILVNIGAFMADRFLFQPSLGFAIVVGVLLYRCSQANFASELTKKGIVGAVIVLAVGLGGFKTITRNADWKSNETLYPHDVEIVPNSAKALLSAGEAYMHMAGDSTTKISEAEKSRLYKTAFTYYDRALKVYPNFNDAYLRQIVTLIMMGRYDETEAPIKKAAQLYPDNSKLQSYRQVVAAYYFRNSVSARQKSFKFLEQKQQDSADFHFQKAVDLSEKAVRISPNFAEGYMELGNYYGFLKQYERSYQNFEKALALEPQNPQVWFNAGMSYMQGGKTEEGKKALEKCIQLAPNGQLAPQARGYLQGMQGVSGKGDSGGASQSAPPAPKHK